MGRSWDSLSHGHDAFARRVLYELAGHVDFTVLGETLTDPCPRRWYGIIAIAISLCEGAFTDAKSFVAKAKVWLAWCHDM